MSSGWEFVLYFLLMQAPIANAGIIIDGNDKPAAIELNVIVDDRTPKLNAKSHDKPAKIHVDNEQQKHERGLHALPLLFNKNCELDDLKCQLRESRRKTREHDELEKFFHSIFKYKQKAIAKNENLRRMPLDLSEHKTDENNKNRRQSVAAEKLVKTLRDVLAKNSRTKKQKAARLMDMDDEDECPFPLCNVRANKKSGKTLKDELNNKNIQSEQRTLLDFQQFGPNLPSIVSFKPGKADLDTMFRRMLTKTYTKQQKQQMAKIVKEMIDKKMKQEHGIGKYQMHGDKLTDDEHQQRALPNDADLLRKKVAAAGGENDSSKVPIVLIGHLDPEQTKTLTKAGIPIGLEKLA
ncbi:hypothetical protein niasHT_008388 [Heterodera trifolii]|uniref:Uncharacterized protein n=1 Tax=Heterodera trifolii TaxID=157864 RepID=A0ABD2LTA3_9BILA